MAIPEYKIVGTRSDKDGRLLVATRIVGYPSEELVFDADPDKWEVPGDLAASIEAAIEGPEYDEPKQVDPEAVPPHFLQMLQQLVDGVESGKIAKNAKILQLFVSKLKVNDDLSPIVK